MAAGDQERYGAEQAEIAAYRERQNRQYGAPRRVLGIDVRPYVGFKMPGLAQATMFSDPYKLLKNGDKMRAAGKQLCWRDPADPVTKSMCLRGVLRPISTKELDPASPYATVDRVKILTSEGPLEVVRTPKGLGLFEAPSSAEMQEYDQGLLPGDHWDKAYLSGLADTADQFSSDLETLSQGSLQGRVSGSLTERDQAREMIL